MVTGFIHSIRAKFRTTLACMIALAVFGTASVSAWPSKAFAPYVYLGAGDQFQATQCERTCGQKFYTIAFIVADKNGKPCWHGRVGLEKNLYAVEIEALRKVGGDVIVSFGGADETEMAIAETNAAALQEKYEAVIDRYMLTWLDFDIEGNALANTPANARRNAVLARLETKHPGLRISYTLPVDPEGIPEAGRQLLANARDSGAKVFSVNVMTMDFGVRFSRAKKMSDVSVASALKAYEQCRQIDAGMRLGLTPMIGQNDQAGEIFTQEDARALVAWARKQPWVCSLSFWSSNRDAGRRERQGNGNRTSGIEQEPWAFTTIFKTFTTDERVEH